MDKDRKNNTIFSIVTYEAPKYFEECFNNLGWVKKHPHIKVVIFDNSSSDDIKKVYDKDPQGFQYYKSPENLGYGKSHNKVWEIGKEKYDAERILILNPDLILNEEDFLLLERKLDANEKCAITAPMILDEDGEIEPSIFTDPSGFGYFFYFLKQFLGISQKERFGIKEMDTEGSVKGVTGACFLIRGESIKEEFIFDPQFFMYFEDLDLCSRLRKDNWKINFIPDSSIIHFHGKSSEDFSDREMWLKEMMYRSLKLYFDKDKGFLNRTVLNFSLYTALQLRILFNKDKDWAIKMKKELY